MNKKIVCLELIIISTFPLVAQASERISVHHGVMWWIGTVLLCLATIATISFAIYLFNDFEEEIGIILLCALPFEINGLLSLFLWWNYWHSIAFVLVCALLIVIIACSLTPLIFFEEHKVVAFTSIPSLVLTICGCVLIKSKLHEIWWLWKYLLVGVIGIAVSWILAGFVILIEKWIMHIIEMRPLKLAEKERKLEERIQRENEEKKQQQLEEQREAIVTQQKEAEHQREEENRQSQLKKLVKKVEDAVLLFQSSVDKKEPVNLQLLKMIEDALSEMQSRKNMLEKHDREELKRNKKYCKIAFEEAKKLEGFTQSANVRMDEILKMFDDVTK